MRELTVCNTGGVFDTPREAVVDLEDIRHHPDKTLWLDLVTPNEEDIRVLREEFRFHPLAIEDVVRGHQRPKVDSYPDYYFVVFYIVGLAEPGGEIRTEPLYLFIGRNYLVTIHAEPIPQIRETLRRWRAPDAALGQDVGALVYALLDAIVDDYFPVMDDVADRVDDLEEHIFEKFDEGALTKIFNLKKELLQMRRVVAPERDVLNVMLRRDIRVFGNDDVTYLQDVYDHIVRVIDSLDTYRDLLSSALDSFLSMQSNRLNQVVKALTITSIILMSATLVAGVYGMNFEYMPELAWRYGYAWALGLMVAVSGSLILWFRHIKWL